MRVRGCRWAVVGSAIALLLLLRTLCASAQVAEPALQDAGIVAPAKEGAADSAAPPAGYMEAVEQAFHEFELGNYVEARSKFLEANRLRSSAQLLRALGMVEFELKNYVACLSYLDRALASTERPLTDEQRRETERLRGQARDYVAGYQITVEPRDANLFLDGIALVPPADGMVLLQLGDHVIEARSPGYQAARHELHIFRASDEQLTIKLLPLPRLEERPVMPEPATPAPALVKAKQPLRKKWWLWTAVGSAVVAGVLTPVLVHTLNKPEPNLPSGGNTGAVLYLPK